MLYSVEFGSRETLPGVHDNKWTNSRKILYYWQHYFYCHFSHELQQFMIWLFSWFLLIKSQTKSKILKLILNQIKSRKNDLNHDFIIIESNIQHSACIFYICRTTWKSWHWKQLSNVPLCLSCPKPNHPTQSAAPIGYFWTGDTTEKTIKLKDEAKQFFRTRLILDFTRHSISCWSSLTAWSQAGWQRTHIWKCENKSSHKHLRVCSCPKPLSCRFTGLTAVQDMPNWMP